VILWIDAHLSPSLAPWITANFAVEAFSLARLGYRDSSDRSVFEAARVANAVVVTKDHDFVLLLQRLGPPPSVIWIRCGNTSMARLRGLLAEVLPRALNLLSSGEVLVEIVDRPPL
jgi:predicted nuclease of predicted toxin-antitoxin system